MKPRIFRLKNQLPVILIPMKGAASMTMQVFVHVGSRYEPKELNGSSHFIEHLMFKGTKKRPNTQKISTELDRYGAEYNAFTSKDCTSYYIKMDAAHTPLAVDLLHDMLTNSLFDSGEIDRERGVIIEEINMYEDNPGTQMMDLLEEALFPENALGWNIAGPRDVIRSVTREQLLGFRDAYYIPSRMVIALAGNVSEDVLPLLEKTFGRIKEPRQLEDRSFEPFQADRFPDGLSLMFREKKIEQVQLGMAFHGFPIGDPRLPAVALLSNILGGTMSSRLFTEVRERRGLCYSIHSGHQGYQDTGMFDIVAGLEKKRVKEAIQVIWDELDKLQTTLVTKDELARAKDHRHGKLALAFEDSATRADWYGKQFTFQGKIETPEERLEKIDAVSASDIREAARALFQRDRYAASLVGPFSNEKEVRHLFEAK